MLIDINNLPGEEEVVTRVKEDIFLYGLATFSRAIPSAYDGFKFINRRILYTCWENKVLKEKFTKIVKLGGLVAQYHPHGDSSINETIIAMAQDAIQNHPLLEGDGNFGSFGDLDTASPRYIAVRWSPFGWDVVGSMMDTKVMEMMDAEADIGSGLKEPKYLPSKVPLVLINGATSIAESFVSNIPQHNLRDVVSMVVKFIRNKNISPYDITLGIYPDYVSGGTIINGDDVHKYYYDSSEESGRTIKVRGDVEIDNVNNRIIIKSMPHLFDLDSVKTKVIELMNDKDKNGNPKNTIFANIKDHGEIKNKGENPQFFIVCKNGTNLLELLESLYKNTNLEYSNRVQLTTNSDGRINRSTIKDMIKNWYHANYDIRRRKLVHSINTLSNKIHILEGLVQIYDVVDDVIKLITSSNGTKDEVIQSMCSKFKLTPIQAKAIHEMNVGSLSRKSKSDYIDNIAKTKELIIENENNLLRIDEIMVDEALEVGKKYGRNRRTKIIGKLKERNDVIISNGAILATRNSVGIFDSSNVISGKKITNGFKGVKINGVWVKEIVSSHRIENNIETILVFYSNGSISSISPNGNINCWIGVQNTEENGYIKSICPIYKGIKGTVACITDDGSLKRFELDSITSRIVNITTVVEDCVFIPDGNEDKTILLVNKNGESLHIKVGDIPSKGRTSQGVMSSFTSGKGVKLEYSGSNSHFVLLLENTKLKDAYVYIQPISEIKVMSRTNKLKKIFDFYEFECLGVSAVDMAVKDQLGIFISDNSTTSLKVSNLKNLNSPRKINCTKAFDFISIELS